MFTNFFFELREAGIPVSIREYLTLLEGLDKGVAGISPEAFYFFARSAMVKDEQFFDRFDQVFAHVFQGAMKAAEHLIGGEVPEEWLQSLARQLFTDEEMAEIEQLSLDELLERLAERLEEQKSAHRGGNKWIGTGGKSPFGHDGMNPAGVRIGGDGGGRHAVKMWQRREFRSLDGNREIGTRNIKMALRRLRRFAREGAADEFDLGGTVRATADNAGMLDIRMLPERRNRVKVLLFLDVGGSMDMHVRTSEELFSAVRTEFKSMTYYYFHNCPYERVWRDNPRGYNEWLPTAEVINTFPSDTKVIFVGDATMGPYEISEVGGSIEHWNDEPGASWMRRVTEAFPSTVWLNPEPREYWDHTSSVRLMRQLVGNRMFPLTLDGLDEAIGCLRRA